MLRGEAPERIPWMTYGGYPRGSTERELRNMGLGILDICAVHEVERPDVRLEIIDECGVKSRPRRWLHFTEHYGAGLKQKNWREHSTVTEIFHTPLGDLKQKFRSYGSGGTWYSERMFKDHSDYEKLRFLVEDTKYTVVDEQIILDRKKFLGDDGLLMAVLERSALQQMIVEFMGIERVAIEVRKHPKEFSEIIETILAKQEELAHVVANVPVELFWIPDNLDGAVCGPKLFEEYVLPSYEIFSEILHSRGKILLSHMDGRLKVLCDVIKKTNIDVVEAFTPPPIGDLSIIEAK
ncbi:MAG: uroporphyrinogen decarboxylase family protein, partial [Candidatus Bathyarchaeia archaeon]